MNQAKLRIFSFSSAEISLELVHILVSNCCQLQDLQWAFQRDVPVWDSIRYMARHTGQTTYLQCWQNVIVHLQ